MQSKLQKYEFNRRQLWLWMTSRVTNSNLPTFLSSALSLTLNGSQWDWENHYECVTKWLNETRCNVKLLCKGGRFTTMLLLYVPQ